MLSHLLQQMGIAPSSLWEVPHIVGKHSHVFPSASHREWFGTYPQVKQELCLCPCLIILAVISKVIGLGKLLSGKEFTHELWKYICF